MNGAPASYGHDLSGANGKACAGRSWRGLRPIGLPSLRRRRQAPPTIRSAAKGRRKSFCRLPCPQHNSVLTPSTARSRAVLRYATPPIGVTSVARAVLPEA